jgi:hypothetical protein
MNVNSLNLALKQASRKLSVPLDLVEQVYTSYWAFVRETAVSQPLKQVSIDEAKKLTTNFNIPYIGKLHVDYNQITKYQNRNKYYQENVRNKENQANRQSGLSD